MTVRIGNFAAAASFLSDFQNGFDKGKFKPLVFGRDEIQTQKKDCV